MRLQIFDADYTTSEGLEVKLFGKNSEGVYKIKDTNFKPYFYAIPDNDVTKLIEDIEDKDFETEDGEKLEIVEFQKTERKDGQKKIEAVKIFADIPADISKLKNALWSLESVEECREFDIPFYRRYLIDKNIRPGSWVEIEGVEKNSGDFKKVIELEEIKAVDNDEKLNWNSLAFDLEVIDEKVVMASFYSEDFQKVLSIKQTKQDFVEKVENQEELLKRFIEIVEENNTDILLGYNTDEFDFDILRETADQTGVKLNLGRNGERMKFNRRGRFKGARIKARMHLDIYPFVTHVLAPGLDSETLDLDSVAEEMIGLNKDELEWGEMKQIWRNDGDLEKFAKYALKDSEITYKLGEQTTPQIMEMSKITGLIPFDTCRLTYGQLTENYLLREAYSRNILANNRPSQKKRRNRDQEQAYAGGFVYTPEEGLYENVAVFDFRSLYPTVMVSHNISPDTLNLEECSDRFELEEFDYDFCQDQQGFFPELVEDLVSSRYKLKKEMKNYCEESQEFKNIYNRQQAQKILANSFYGYLGYGGARWYSRESAEATTYLGREYIKDAIQIAEEMGFEMTYGDTDSVMLRKDDLEEHLDEFLDAVNSELPDFMELEFEGLFKRGFFTSKESGEGAKKKYALIDDENNLKITGFEQVRRDWSPIAKDTQEKVLQKVLENDIDAAVEEVKDTIKALKSREVDVEKLKIYTTLTKPPEEYANTAPHVEAAKKAKEKGEEIKPESTVDYVITRRGKSISEKAKLTKYAETYDSDYYVDNQVIPVALRVLKVFGYTEDELKGKGRQSGLGQF